MGDPAFKIRDLIKRENIRVFSSNYALYGDLSRRVGDTLSTMVPTVESYSIDESFLNLGEFNEREVETLARELRERVLAVGWHPYLCRYRAAAPLLAELGAGEVKLHGGNSGDAKFFIA